MTLSQVWSRWSNHIIFAICIIGVLLLLGKNLSPFSAEMFTGHDETQVGRIQQFIVNLQQGQFPPRISPDMSFGMGFPIFNFYAPTAYWITTTFALIGLPIIAALKLSYLVAILIGFVAMTLFLRIFFEKPAAMLGAAAYVTTPYLAIDIFVRANLAETWFFALFPLGLYMLLTVSKKRLLVTVIVLSLMFTSHNVLSLVSVGIALVLSLLMKEKKLSLLSIVFAILASAYFLVPAIAELSLVQAQTRAVGTVYADHFLCVTQLWSSLWGFAGSAPGCSADGMSFQIGKIQILLGIAGLVWFSFNCMQKQKIHHRNIFIFIATLGLGSLFMVLPLSQFIWDLFEPILSLFQFPWRFLIFIVFGLAFFTSYLLHIIRVPLKLYGIIAIIVVLFVFNQKFFYGQTVSTSDFNKTYLSEAYITQTLAYKAAEYIPYTVDYTTWRSLEGKDNKALSTPIVMTGNEEVLVLKDEGFDRLFSVKATNPVIINIHYAPYWKIMFNNEEIMPTDFDKLGRPIIELSGRDFDTIQVQYKQTQLEMISNFISFVTFLSLFILSFKSISWTKLKIKKI